MRPEAPPDPMFSAKILAIVLTGTALGCARPTYVRQRLADGTVLLKCDEPAWVCLSHVEDVCKGGPFVVYGGWDEPRRAGVEQSQVESHRSQVRVRCVRELSKNMPPESVHAPAVVHTVPGAAAAPPRATPAKAPAAPARACVPGATQACVGAAACSGGQACLADGSGFGPCDCGSR